MLSKQRTTYILLERGTEDMMLLAEIRKLIAAAGIQSIRTLATDYPTLLELKQSLIKEKGEG